MSSSKAFKASGARQVPPPPNSRAGTPYTRFIPREELQGFASWSPDAIGVAAGSATTAAAAPRSSPVDKPVPTAPSAEEWQARANAARQSGYQDGYRDGLVALESFKQSFASQMSGQFSALLTSFDEQLKALERSIAVGIAKAAAQLARQVLRHELATRPELVAQVAQEAVHTVLASARQIVVLVHPADHALIGIGAAEALADRGARLQARPGMARGGCLVESDAGSVDARIETRWAEAVARFGSRVGWSNTEAAETRDEIDHKAASKLPDLDAESGADAARASDDAVQGAEHA